MLKFSGVASSMCDEEMGLLFLFRPNAALLPLFPDKLLKGGESDLLRSKDAFPIESPLRRLGLACFLLGPLPAGPGLAL